MGDTQDVKQRLPYPYNQDLSGVLRRLDRRTPFSRKRLANDPVTAAYIAAAMRLIQRHLGPEAERVLADPEDENSIGRPLLAFLSQRAVAAEVANNPDPFPKCGTTATLRSRWRSHSDFIADLLNFGLWSVHSPAGYDAKIGPETERLIEGPDFVEAAHRLAYYDLTFLIGETTFRLEMIAAAAAEGDEVIQEALVQSHRGFIKPWKQLYAEMLLARGLQLRPGIDLDDFAEILAALVSGFGVRGVGVSKSLAVDHDKQRSLFGSAALALLLGCVERTDNATQTSVEEAVSQMIYGS
jgi:hypothetical protein